MINRRGFTTTLAGTALVALRAMPSRAAAPAWPADLERSFAQIEAASGGRLGVAVLDTATGATTGYRPGERFPLCSTFKVLAAGAILARVDAAKETLERRIHFTQADLVSYSPITKQHVGEGMTLADLCAAAIDYSDNTAGNMLLREIGGPAGLTAFTRTLGDSTTRLDRTETALNEALPGDPRDTSTPQSMLADLEALALGSALKPASRDQLVVWLKANTTGGARLRAGFPKDWVIGDKTGTGERGTANHIAIAWPPGRKPLLIAVYLTGSTGTAEGLNASILAVGQAVAAGLPPT